MKSCTIEVFRRQRWVPIATFESVVEAEGYNSRSHLNYDDLYALDHLGATDDRAVSCRYPPSLELYSERRWPAFIFDILPSGAGRAALAARLGVRDNDSRALDWAFLTSGAGYPPGNLRIASAVVAIADDHPGFTREQIVGRDQEFVEYMHEHGAIVAGQSGVQGEAPKFLLTEDEAGRYHPDGLLDDSRARRHWLVKWPRGRRESDRTVLRNEAAYYSVAGKLGLRTFGKLEHIHDTLFVPRFDRGVTREGVMRFGQESLCSLAGIAEFGAYVTHQTLLAALATWATSESVVEYVKRDVVNIVLGNTDNHGRNTAVTKTPDGKIDIAPLFDLAPMFLDEDVIPRVTRWKDIETMSTPDWPRVLEVVQDIAPRTVGLRMALVALGERLNDLPEHLRAAGADDAVIERRVPVITETRLALEALRL